MPLAVLHLLAHLNADTVDQRLFAHRHDDSARPEDRDTAQDAEMWIEGTLCDLLSALHRDRDLNRPGIAELCAYLPDSLRDHTAWDTVDRRCPNRLLQPRLRDTSDSGATVYPYLRRLRCRIRIRQARYRHLCRIFSGHLFCLCKNQQPIRRIRIIAAKFTHCAGCASFSDHRLYNLQIQRDTLWRQKPYIPADFSGKQHPRRRKRRRRRTASRRVATLQAFIFLYHIDILDAAFMQSLLRQRQSVRQLHKTGVRRDPSRILYLTGKTLLVFYLPVKIGFFFCTKALHQRHDCPAMHDIGYGCTVRLPQCRNAL